MKRFANIRFRRPSRFTWFILLSVLFHILLLWHTHHNYEPYSFPEKGPIEITELPTEPRKTIPEAKKEKRPEVAETEELPNNEIDPNATFLGEKNQKAQQETKASQIDDFRKKQGTGLQNSLSQSKIPPPTGNPNEAGKESSDIGEEPSPQSKKAAGVKRDWKKLTLQDLGLGGKDGPMAATDDRLDGVNQADRTVLSTREFKFYSYYHRIKETLRQYWKPNVERKLAIMWGKGTKMKDAELVTQVLVLLDESGSVTRITRVGSSGFAELDEAAMEAFQQAAPFPNPPVGMKDPDGLVRIRWDFILKTEASPQISFRGNRRSMP